MTVFFKKACNTLYRVYPQGVVMFVRDAEDGSTVYRWFSVSGAVHEVRTITLSMMG